MLYQIFALIQQYLKEKDEILQQFKNFKFPPPALIKRFFEIERKIADLESQSNRMENKKPKDKKKAKIKDETV